MPSSDDEIRTRLLETGLQLLHDRGVQVGVHHVRLSEVVSAAGLTTGAAYRRWETQDDYHRDLALAAIAWRSAGSVANTLAAIRPLAEAGAPAHELLRVGSVANIHKMPDDTGFLASLALRFAAPADPALAAASRARQAEAVAEYARLYAVMLATYRRRMRPPLTVAHLAEALGALSEGFASRAMYEPDHPRFQRAVSRDIAFDAGDDEEPREWTLLGAAVLAIVEGFTESDPTGTERQVPSDGRLRDAAAEDLAAGTAKPSESSGKGSIPEV